MSNCFIQNAAKAARTRAKIITCCFWRRPAYTEQVLAYLSHCEGIGDYLLLIQQDGGGGSGAEAVRALCQNVRFADCRMHTEPEHRGCNVNTRLSLAWGFHHADYVLHVEDDILLSPDALRYFEWAKQFDGDKSLVMASAWGYPPAWNPSTSYPKQPGNDDQVSSHAGVWVWGFATWRDRWEEFDRIWTGCTNDKDESWDCRIAAHVNGQRLSLMPHASRSLNIGEHDGTHRGAAMLPYWAGSPNCAPTGNFQRV